MNKWFVLETTEEENTLRVIIFDTKDDGYKFIENIFEFERYYPRHVNYIVKELQNSLSEEEIRASYPEFANLSTSSRIIRKAIRTK